jgi:hypothetical protein
MTIGSSASIQDPIYKMNCGEIYNSKRIVEKHAGRRGFQLSKPEPAWKQKESQV